MVVRMRSKGRRFSYIQEEIGVCHDVIRRERGYCTAPVKPEKRANRGSGFLRSFDPACASSFPKVKINRHFSGPSFFNGLPIP
jgi:hypothetical protein